MTLEIAHIVIHVLITAYTESESLIYHCFQGFNSHQPSTLRNRTAVLRLRFERWSNASRVAAQQRVSYSYFGPVKFPADR